MKRLYVHDSIYDAVCDELVVLADEAVVGDGLEQGTQLGPLQNKMQYDKVMDLIADAKKHGRSLPAGERPTVRAISSARRSSATSPMELGWSMRNSSARCSR
jgi:acyl-CoA reductase-like NAD-dependent aldehyde dehydrogenase